jgi:hypothetical protein
MAFNSTFNNISVISLELYRTSVDSTVMEKKNLSWPLFDSFSSKAINSIYLFWAFSLMINDRNQAYYLDSNTYLQMYWWPLFD